jgi:DNA-binding NarL/FixJ family response regulator
MSGDIIRVVLADDHGVVRAGLKATLQPARDIQVVGEASNGREAVEVVTRLEPDVVVMDLSMPVMDGCAATREIAATGTNTRVLILTMHAEEDFLVEAMRAGAAGYLLKTDAGRDLADAVRAVAYGDVYVRPAGGRILANQLMKKQAPQTDRERYDQLTERERSVLRLVGMGYSAPEIGERLFISPKTVDTYKHRIQEKLELTHRSQYVQFALKLGLLTTG